MDWIHFMSANQWDGIPDHIARQIEAAMARGRKIEAIKVYRRATNCGLKEAKDAVEAMERGQTIGGRTDARRDVTHITAKRPGQTG